MTDTTLPEAIEAAIDDFAFAAMDFEHHPSNGRKDFARERDEFRAVISTALADAREDMYWQERCAWLEAYRTDLEERAERLRQVAEAIDEIQDIPSVMDVAYMKLLLLQPGDLADDIVQPIQEEK